MVPREQIEDPVRSLVMGLPLDLEFRTKGQLAIDISTDAAAESKMLSEATTKPLLTLKALRIRAVDRRGRYDLDGGRIVGIWDWDYCYCWLV